jgi:hypothetical protein
MIDGRPQPLEDLTEFQREVWQRTVASEASTFFKPAALQVARQRAISLSATTLPATCSARAPGRHGLPGASESFGRPYRDRAGSHAELIREKNRWHNAAEIDSIA